MIVVPICLGLIFLLLYLSFGSIGNALLIILNVPFALIGSVFALWISGQFLSAPSAVGFIALFGVAVLNGVVRVSISINSSLKGSLSRRRLPREQCYASGHC
jgi:cobalt-zinc-cadmium resistance protein CzcA